MKEVSGRMSHGALRAHLYEWRVSDLTAESAATVAQLLGGTPVPGDRDVEVLTSSSRVRIVLEGAQSVATEMRLWGPQGLVHHCDGILFLSPSAVEGTPCGCPKSSDERALLAKKLQAPNPVTSVSFRLAECYGIGRFEFSSPSRILADAAPEIRNQLSRISGEALCELALELVTVAVSGGVEVSYRMPTLSVLGPWS